MYEFGDCCHDDGPFSFHYFVRRERFRAYGGVARQNGKDGHRGKSWSQDHHLSSYRLMNGAGSYGRS